MKWKNFFLTGKKFIMFMQNINNWLLISDLFIKKCVFDRSQVKLERAKPDQLRPITSESDKKHLLPLFNLHSIVEIQKHMNLLLLVYC